MISFFKRKILNRSNSFIVDLFFSSATLLSVIFLWKYPFIIFCLLLLLSISWLLILRNKDYLYFYLIVALSGATSEILCIYTGVWQYSRPQIFGIPYWLPLVWGMASLFSKNIFTCIQKND